MVADALGDRMKEYESLGTPRLMPLLPVLVRVDGRAFHTFTKGLARPFSEPLSLAMQETAKALVEETNALLAYAQSDEISLLLYSDKPDTQLYFDGKWNKITSMLASLATLKFNYYCRLCLGPVYAGKQPLFDCRVWNVPNKVEAANYFLWREQDATRNSISMAAQAQFSHTELHGKDSNEMQEMLHTKGINWNDYPPWCKRGTYIQRKVVSTPFTTAELEALPPKHHARTNPDLVVERSQIDPVVFPIFSTIANRVEVIFDGAEPICKT
jgi:tRNA(His) guanylyltransferase